MEQTASLAMVERLHPQVIYKSNQAPHLNCYSIIWNVCFINRNLYIVLDYLSVIGLNTFSNDS